jgi:hypothetical protein
MAKKPGPPAYKPTATQRRRVMRGIAVGPTLPQLAADIGVTLSTLRRAFDSEIRLGRVRAILDNLDRLHASADDGNVSAMKALAQMMRPRAGNSEEDTEEDDTWADLFPNVSRNMEIH